MADLDSGSARLEEDSQGGACARTGPTLNREDLLLDSQATLREVAEILRDLWDLPAGRDQWVQPRFEALRRTREEDTMRILAATHREVEVLREGIGAVRALLPYSPAHGPGTDSRRWQAEHEASGILEEAEARLERLSLEMENQGIGME